MSNKYDLDPSTFGSWPHTPKKKGNATARRRQREAPTLASLRMGMTRDAEMQRWAARELIASLPCCVNCCVVNNSFSSRNPQTTPHHPPFPALFFPVRKPPPSPAQSTLRSRARTDNHIGFRRVTVLLPVTAPRLSTSADSKNKLSGCPT